MEKKTNGIIKTRKDLCPIEGRKIIIIFSFDHSPTDTEYIL